MALPVWGNLEKSQTDAEKIEEAITRLILEHCEDETAHLGEGQSLQSHKASEIIDHLAESIIADKIRDYSINPAHLVSNKVAVCPSLESLAVWTPGGAGSATLKLGSLELNSGAALYNLVSVYAPSNSNETNLGVNNPVFEAVLRFSQITDQVGHFGAGQFGVDFVGFGFYNDELYAYIYVNSALTVVGAIAVDLSVYHTYRVVCTSGQKVEFYVDEDLYQTSEAVLPRSISNSVTFSVLLQTLAASSKIMYLSVIRFFRDI
ncbi:MAG: hypothetical protein PHN89_04325 [Candidatus Pacebacteria bacterium]|nr:hypothetical protein [Candidatus Paceibacterota bacterium]